MTLEKKIILSSFGPDMICAGIIFCYSFIPAKIITQLPFRFFTPIFIFLIALLVVLQFILAPITDHIIYSGTSKRLQEAESEKTDIHSRTKLFEDVMNLPLYCAIQTFVYFVIGALLIFAFYKQYMKINTLACYLSLLECLMGSIIASLYAYNYSLKISSGHACRLIKKGVDKEYLMKKKSFSLKIANQMELYIIVPMICAFIISNAVLVSGYLNYPFTELNYWIPRDIQIEHMALTCIVNSIVQIVLDTVFYRHISKSSNELIKILEEIENNDLTNANFIETDMSDEIAYNHYLSNRMLDMLRDTLAQFQNTASTLNESSINLSQISAETNATSLEQAAGTKEIVETMKATTELSHHIEEKISEVASLANITKEDVLKGNDVLSAYVEKIKLIEKSNSQTIEGIKALNTKINSIWEVVTLINSIADQTKIIAFNAELESNSVRQKSNNFKNVSNEVRRLANSTVDSTREIKDKITEIQKASENLIKCSLESTKQIHIGMNMVELLNQNFDNISRSANTNAASSYNIKELITQQTVSFDQIQTTLTQISNGIQRFTESTATINQTAATLQQHAFDLEEASKTGASND